DLTRLELVVPDARARIIILDVPSFDVDASDIRSRVLDGRPIAYLVPDAVRRYVEEKRLYNYLGAAAVHC
ncbi:MAG TPA: hypothetical protein VKT80_00300, partial [Chloroflexota bacterium]|nr:hypothetical protein [Chloroflexota bacterium]